MTELLSINVARINVIPVPMPEATVPASDITSSIIELALGKSMPDQKQLQVEGNTIQLVEFGIVATAIFDGEGMDQITIRSVGEGIYVPNVHKNPHAVNRVLNREPRQYPVSTISHMGVLALLNRLTEEEPEIETLLHKVRPRLKRLSDRK